MAGQLPQKIDRFNIQKVLGKGAQGVVYLAGDPELERQVAIKTLHLQDALQDESELEQLLLEARAVSKLQDDNIVSIFDIGRQGTEAYLVLEYIEGQSLDRTIRQNPPMSQKLSIIKDMVSGVAAAHAKDIIHCDLKPANILIQQDGKAKVADFGLALLTEGNHGGDNELYGTPQYMAPEYIETSKHQKVSDVFSVGLVCYELLTGKTAFSGDDVYQVINAIAHSEVTPPSEVNPEVDEGLNTIIMKALEKDPANRYGGAGELLQALNDYMALSDGSSSGEGEDATVQFLLRRMRHKKDFPMFSRTISTVNRASSSDTESLTSISNAILKDFSLTNKILRLVNSVHYNRSGQKITTISRAVVMMGINPIRTIAASIMLFEHMQNKAQESSIKDEAVQALFSAMVANQLATASMPKNHEEAFLCALLQHLGKMLVSFYLHEEYQAIDKLMVQKQCSEEAAVQEVLGVSYARLGAAVAREWGFPDLLADSLKPLDFDDVPEKGTPEEQLRVISQFSHALTNTLTLPKHKQASAMKTLTNQFSDVLKLDEKKVSVLIDNSTKELTDFSRLIEYNFGKSNFYKQMVGDIPDDSDSDQASNDHQGMQSGVTVLDEDTTQFSTDSKQSLTDGIQDISNALTGDFSINQIMQMILETIFRAFPGSRVMLCLKDGKTSSIRGRFGYGENVNDIIDQFVIPLTYQNDVFHVAFKNSVDIRIDDTRDAKIINKIPDWYHDNVGARSFTIFPIVIKNSPIALIYIDSAGDKAITINDEQLGLLKTLRNQAILAIKSMS